MIWKNVEGYKVPYRVSDEGVVERWSERSQKWYVMRQRLRGGRAIVTLRGADDRQKAVAVVRLMDDAFFGGYAKKHGLVILHKNGAKLDCAVENLLFCTRQEMGKLTGGIGRRKAVMRRDRWGGVTVYPTIQAAAEQNGLNRTTLTRWLKSGQMDPRGYLFEVVA